MTNDEDWRGDEPEFLTDEEAAARNAALNDVLNSEMERQGIEAEPPTQEELDHAEHDHEVVTALTQAGFPLMTKAMLDFDEIDIRFVRSPDGTVLSLADGEPAKVVAEACRDLRTENGVWPHTAADGEQWIRIAGVRDTPKENPEKDKGEDQG